MERLTDNQYNVLNKIASQTKMDCWFYIHTKKNGADVIKDLENNKFLPLRAGIAQLNDGIVPDLIDLTDEEWNTYFALLEELKITNEIEKKYAGNGNGVCC